MRSVNLYDYIRLDFGSIFGRVNNLKERDLVYEKLINFERFHGTVSRDYRKLLSSGLSDAIFYTVGTEGIVNTLPHLPNVITNGKPLSKPLVNPKLSDEIENHVSKFN